MGAHRAAPSDAADLHSLDLGGRTVAFRLRRSARRRIRIVVTREGAVEVRAPPRASVTLIFDAVRAQARWLIRTLARVEALPPRPAPPRYADGETLPFLGRPCLLRVAAGRTNGARLRGGVLHVTVRGGADPARTRRAVEEWYRRRAAALFVRLMRKCARMAARHGLPPAALTLRCMRTRWGSCTAKGRITLNVYLAQAPIECAEYVLMHELCHRVHLNHSPAFYQLLDACLPDWRERRRRLNQIALPRAEQK